MAMRHLQLKGNAKNDLKVMPNILNFRGRKFQNLSVQPGRDTTPIMWLDGERYKSIQVQTWYNTFTLFQFNCIPPSHMASFAIFQVTLLCIFWPMHIAGMLPGAEILAVSVSIPADHDQHPLGHTFTEPEFLRRIIVLLIPNHVARHHPAAHLG